MKPEMNMLNLLYCKEPSRAPSGPKSGNLNVARNHGDEGNPPKEEITPIGRDNNRAVKPPFKKIIQSVIVANKKAMAAKGDIPCRHKETSIETAKSSESGQTRSEQSLPVQDVQESDILKLASELASAGIDCGDFESILAGEGAMTAQTPDASTIIQNAIEKISQILNLKIGQEWGALDLNNPSQAVKEEFAEILYALQGIAGLLNDAVTGNQSLEIGGKALDAAQAVSVEKTLRIEIFHIEFALSILDCGREVAALVAGKKNLPSDTGLIQAINPNELAMPASQIKQVLEQVLVSKEQKVETLFSKLALSLRGSAVSGQSTGVEKTNPIPADPTLSAQEATVTEAKSSDNGKTASDVGGFDPKVLRLLLKIDKTATGNADAVNQNEKMDLPKITEMLFAKNPGDAIGGNEDKPGYPFNNGFAGKSPINASGAITDFGAAAVPKAVEESLINQLSGKLHAAIKTGVTEIRLLLKPESLGEMRVKLTLDGDVVMGKIYVENQQVKHIIENNMQSLKDSLAQHNLQTGTFDVNVGGNAREQLNEAANPLITRPEERDDGLTDTSENPVIPDESVGKETGRRFGSNTIEYFA